MRTRLYNARILTMETEKIQKGEIWIFDSIIKYIGPAKENEIGAFDIEIDAKNNLVMPGFKNAHSHSAMTFARSYADGYPLDIWLNKIIFPMEAKLTPRDIYYFTILAYMEYFSSGITSNFDMYYIPDAIYQASLDSQMRTVLCGAVNNYKDSVDFLEDCYINYNEKSSLVSFILGFHAEYTTDVSIIENIGKISQKYNAPVYMHNSETQKEVAECMKRHSLTPTQLFNKCGVYEYGGGGFHCTFLNDEDIEIFKNNKLSVIANTCSNLKLGSGVAPIHKYLESKLNIALGTDGASSNNSLNVFREMYTTAMLQNITNNTPFAIPPFELLKMCTINAANAMNLSNCSTLSIGKKADLIIIDLNKPNMQPETNIINNLVYSCNAQNIILTMVDGKIVYQNGNYLTIDQEKTMYEVNKLLKTLL